MYAGGSRYFALFFLISLPLLLNIEKWQNPTQKPWPLVPFYWVTDISTTAYDRLSSNISQSVGTYFYFVGLNKSHDQLLKQNQAQQVQLSLLQKLQIENQRLREILQFQKQSPLQLLPAQVIGYDIALNHNIIILNRGKKHGIKPLMGVVSAHGVVGYITQVFHSTCHVLLLFDPLSAIDAMLQKARVRGIAEGASTHAHKIEFKYIPHSTAVQVGDRIVTSGQGKQFPQGLPIGQVTSVHFDKLGLESQIIVAPYAKVLSLEEVFVLCCQPVP